MKAKSNKLLRNVKSFSQIIKSIDNLSLFFDSTYKSLMKERNEIKKNYEKGLIIDEKIDSFMSSPNKEEGIEALNNFVLENGKKLSSFMAFSYKKEDNKETLNVAIKNTTPKTINPILSRETLSDCDEKIRFLSQSVLENMVCIFELFLSGIFTSFLVYKPLDYLADKKLTFADIYNGPGEPIVKIIEKEVESRMYDSIACLEMLLDKNSVSSGTVLSEFNSFKEIYFRRNIVVHNDGIVNEKYLTGIGNKNPNIKIGDKLECDEAYVKQSISSLMKFLSSIEYEFGKILLSDQENRLTALGSFGFKCLCNKKYDLAEFVYNMLKSDKCIMFSDKLNYIINYLNAKKQQGKNISDELNKLDVSAAQDCYKIAKLCLEDKNEEVLEQLEKTYPKSFGAEEIRDWPIFVSFRETNFYEDFTKRHKDDFDSYVLSDEEQEQLED